MYTLITMIRSLMLTRVRYAAVGGAPSRFLVTLCRRIARQNNNNKLPPAGYAMCLLKAAQTICANAPVLGTGWGFAFLLRLLLCLPAPSSFSLSPSLSSGSARTHTHTRRHVHAGHAHRGNRPIATARQQSYIV